MQDKWIFLNILSNVYHGNVVAPRGQQILELENYSYTLPPYVRFVNFPSRKLNINYIKQEFLWYLKGDKYDVSITSHASLWKSIQNKDGSFNSNYGQYFFGSENQFDQVIKTLANDKDSRRASIMLLTKEHLSSETNDVPCTYALNFRIRENKLNMTVHMRSQDAIYGMSNDAPAFSFLHEMMFNALKEYYSDIEYGDYFHIVDSFHVYEKHWKMLSMILEEDYEEIIIPKVSGPNEVAFLRALDFAKIPSNYLFTKWLTSNTNEST